MDEGYLPVNYDIWVKESRHHAARIIDQAKNEAEAAELVNDLRNEYAKMVMVWYTLSLTDR